MTHKRKSKQKNSARQKIIRRGHRWVGYASLFLVLILSITGLILNHTEKLGLNQIMVHNDVVSALYNMSPPPQSPIHYQSGQRWLSWLEGRLYLDGNFIARNIEPPVGFVLQENFIIVGMRRHISLYLSDGTLIENLDSSSLPGEITALGQDKTGAVLIITSTGNYAPDRDFTSWEKRPDSFSLTPGRAGKAPEHITQKILQDFNGQGISLYRLVLDLHSGHILGSFGVYLMDLAAISLIILGITGLIQHKRNKRSP